MNKSEAKKIIKTDKIYVAIDQNNKLKYSEDEENWTAVKGTNEEFSDVAHDGKGRFVAVAENSNIAAYSDDGIKWKKTKLPIITAWASVCYGKDKFVAVGGGCYDTALYSDDGITWSTAELPEGVWLAVCYGNGKFVAVSGYSYMPEKASWRGVCYGNGKFVAVSGYSNKAAYSEDGINWTKTELPEKASWRFVCYKNDKFIAVAPYSDIAAYSKDGITWTKE